MDGWMEHGHGRKGSVGVSRDCRFFSVPPIISGTGKATNFKLCTHVLSIDRNKKVAEGVYRTLEIFQGTPYIGRIARSSLR